jgi:hypothetical protein
MSTAHRKRHDTVLYMNHRVNACDMLKIVNHCRTEKDLRTPTEHINCSSSWESKESKKYSGKTSQGSFIILL